MKYIVNTDCELVEVTSPEQLEDAHAIFTHRDTAEQYQRWKVEWEIECLKKMLYKTESFTKDWCFIKAELKRLRGIL